MEFFSRPAKENILNNVLRQPVPLDLDFSTGARGFSTVSMSSLVAWADIQF
jgi:hypothetical protein